MCLFVVFIGHEFVLLKSVFRFRFAGYTNKFQID